MELRDQERRVECGQIQDVFCVAKWNVRDMYMIKCAEYMVQGLIDNICSSGRG